MHAARIGVEVKDGVVTLAGEVASNAEKWNAERVAQRVAQRVAGVKAMVCESIVQRSGLSQRSDADIAQAAQAAQNVLTWTSSLPAGAVHGLVEGGAITLSGDADGPYQRPAAADVVRHLVGVTGVSNQIRIKPTVTAQPSAQTLKPR